MSHSLCLLGIKLITNNEINAGNSPNSKVPPNASFVANIRRKNYVKILTQISDHRYCLDL